MLEKYIKHGEVVEKVHEVLSLYQKPWLKTYIDFDTKKTAAKIDYDKNLPKSMNCCFYGKTLENVRNRVKTEFIKKDDDNKLVKMHSN